ncbi:pyruvate, phosphate dikinase [Tissierella creatinophila]|uniref:Pyruvate, phosphate dikinase n=1 Tax=Tissierella creatinophila DSM 6911 TaxID=1123403 RepID=A0A1U7M625_TISCR|nr:pyruvate, phosphate dikinase [Tissierella creatinophila]OLS02735.1 pyruvate, phosphate dikinase [Tissierella creatinophila DSM 6911]
MTNKYVYDFKEGSKEMKELLGGKGANLAEMSNEGFPVPPGFTITTEACIRFFNEGEILWDDLKKEIQFQLENLEKTIGKSFSDKSNPLLVSVRSGSVFSMPGMMDTILNLGLNDVSVEGLAKSTGNERFAYDSYRRFIQMFSDVAMEIPKVRFDHLLEKLKEEREVELDNELSAEDLKELVKQYKRVYLEEIGKEFPQEPINQLELSVIAVFKSWRNPRAVIYRKLHNISENLGTAVNIQSMVYGNMGETSGTGVAFTRNPANGENALYGEYLMNAQGEDVVAGIRTPEPISHLRDIMPDLYDEFVGYCDKLEHHYKDMQDIEFTIENGKLYVLQTRNGKRTIEAAITVATDLIEEGLITKEEAINRVDPYQLDQILHPTFDEEKLAEAHCIATGLGASPGAASGRAYFDADDVVIAKQNGEKCILVRGETSPEDIEGMVSAEGILTSRGGMTSHAAVVARGMGKCCVAGCSEAKINEEEKVMRAGGIVIKEGDYISLDGNTGKVYLGEIAKVQPTLSGNFGKFMEYVDSVRTMGVRANADTPKDAKQGLTFGAEGIGLCRTEHMFFGEERISFVRRMIMANTLEERKAALDKLLPVQRQDFYELYKAMGDRPVTVRLLDPPLHEFIPTREKDIKELAESMNISFQNLKDRIAELQETNPMLGHRGCRLAVTYPEIYRMQARAIIEAAIDIKEEGYEAILPEIMIPLVSHEKEYKYVKAEVLEEIEDVFKERNNKVNYLIGTMLEVPRAAITADKIAEEAEFFSFGTNDLTQMGFGFSRDDAGTFLSDYEEKGIFESSPFEKIDRDGIGELMKIAIKLGKEANPDIKLGICGEHGGEPSSVEFCHMLGLDYVSCSPFRIPIAKLAAAQAAINHK